MIHISIIHKQDNEHREMILKNSLNGAKMNMNDQLNKRTCACELKNEVGYKFQVVDLIIFETLKILIKLS